MVQLFIFVFGRVIGTTIRIRPNTVNPLLGKAQELIVVSVCPLYCVAFTTGWELGAVELWSWSGAYQGRGDATGKCGYEFSGWLHWRCPRQCTPAGNSTTAVSV